jgi:hypothetical protein
LEFWASSESHQPAGMGLERARKCVEPFLNSAFTASSLAALQGKLRYVPIVMPEEMHARYPIYRSGGSIPQPQFSTPGLNYYKP